jgi:plasmid stabilization system protein ParE
MKVEYHPLTASDVNEAVKHYNERRAGLGNEFRAEVYATIERIRNNPYIYTEIEGVRRAFLKRFPYSIVYRVLDEQRLRILLIRHHRRHPDYESQRQ